MHMVFKIFNTLEKIASANKRIVQAYNTMEKAAVTKAGLLTLMGRRKAYIASAMRRNPKLTKQQARNEFYKRYGLQAGEGGKISAVEGANLSKRALEMQQAWLRGLSNNKSISSQLKKLKSKKQHGTKSPAAGKPIQQQTKAPDPAQTKPADPAAGKTTQQQTKAPDPAQPKTTELAQTKAPDPTPVDVPVGNGLFNNNWWKYGLAGAGGALLGRTTAPKPQPMPAMMVPQLMPVPQPMTYNGL